MKSNISFSQLFHLFSLLYYNLSNIFFLILIFTVIFFPRINSYVSDSDLINPSSIHLKYFKSIFYTEKHNKILCIFHENEIFKQIL